MPATSNLPSQFDTFDFIIDNLELRLVFLKAFDQCACQMRYTYTVEKEDWYTYPWNHQVTTALTNRMLETIVAGTRKYKIG